MVVKVFTLYIEDGEELIHKREIGRIALWITENQYFNKNPNARLVLKRFDYSMEMLITADTTQREIIEWGNNSDRAF